MLPRWVAKTFPLLGTIKPGATSQVSTRWSRLVRRTTSTRASTSKTSFFGSRPIRHANSKSCCRVHGLAPALAILPDYPGGNGAALKLMRPLRNGRRPSTRRRPDGYAELVRQQPSLGNNPSEAMRPAELLVADHPRAEATSRTVRSGRRSPTASRTTSAPFSFPGNPRVAESSKTVGSVANVWDVACALIRELTSPCEG